jgi:hypothetical protein
MGKLVAEKEAKRRLSKVKGLRVVPKEDYQIIMNNIISDCYDKEDEPCIEYELEVEGRESNE